MNARSPHPDAERVRRPTRIGPVIPAMAGPFSFFEGFIMTNDTLVLATACLNQSEMPERAARTLLVGAAILNVRHRFGSWSFDLQSDSTTVTDNPADTMLWLGERLQCADGQLLLWRGEDITVPSLIAAAETARDTIAAVTLLRRLAATFTGEVIDVATAFGGSKATSFDAIAHRHGVAFVPMTRTDLAEAHRLGNHGDIRAHLEARAKAMWQLWLPGVPDDDSVRSATHAWLFESDAQAQRLFCSSKERPALDAVPSSPLALEAKHD
ncbi:hypothetical protein [Sphingomonas oligophenolica]|uniref:hypothetical protein n=1 Tax=Sphingomonas oligophenolica TaxID=301154 RepID=UPI00138736B4|nr:hypothetical protein [Sphingomonas oligophenolica]